MEANANFLTRLEAGFMTDLSSVRFRGAIDSLQRAAHRSIDDRLRLIPFFIKVGSRLSVPRILHWTINASSRQGPGCQLST